MTAVYKPDLATGSWKLHARHAWLQSLEAGLEGQPIINTGFVFPVLHVTWPDQAQLNPPKETHTGSHLKPCAARSTTGFLAEQM